MIGQHDIRPINGVPPVRYEAIEECLKAVRAKAKEIGATIHAPRFGSGLAGGERGKIEEIIRRTLIDHDVSVTIYDLPEAK